MQDEQKIADARRFEFFLKAREIALAQCFLKRGERAERPGCAGIVVQRVGTPVQPLLRPHETQYLHEQLALKLAAAELALRRRDDAALRRDIADLTDWANAYLDTGPATTAAALATLKRLADTDLRPPLPDLTGLGEQLDALRRRAAADPMP